MSDRSLMRRGTVSRIGNGCVVVDVSVPCTSCGAGICGTQHRTGTGSIEIRNIDQRTIREGTEIALSVSADALVGSSLRLFGPAIAWALCFALLAPAGWSAPVIGVVGLGFALGTGRLLAVKMAGNLGIAVLAPDELVQEVR